MDETIEWLEQQDRYHGQIQHHQPVSGRSATYCDLNITPQLARVLQRRGIDHVYEHQATAIQTVRDGHNLVIATPTASGKSLTYTVPAIERALDHEGRTLYIAPQRALINDQEEAFSDLVTDLGSPSALRVDQYTGQQSQREKRAVRDRQPTIVLTTPDMLHYGLLPWAYRLWEWLFRGLETVVLDEVHEYRGVFGSHVALLCRRLARVCDRYESAPQFVCCSATIGNPISHASAVTGCPDSSFTLVDEDTSASGPKHWLFWNPPLKKEAADKTSEADIDDAMTDAAGAMSDGEKVAAPIDDNATAASDGGATPDAAVSSPPTAGGDRRSHHPETVRLFCDLVTRDNQTLVFTRTRQGAERYAEWCDRRLRKRGSHEVADAITAYQAALSQSRRTEIEAGLQDGSLRGIWSTNALELGIDIGELDVVLLDGYPGTRMNTTNRQAGRAVGKSQVW